MKDVKVRKELRIEVRRKVFHMGVVFVLSGLFWIMGHNLIPLLSLLLGFGIMASEICIRGYDVPIFSFGIKKFDRPENTVFRPGLGVLSLLTGTLLTLWISLLLGMGRGTTTAALLLSASDTFSTTLGVMFGMHRWKFNRRKTFEGSFAFFISAVVINSFFFSGSAVIIPSLITALVEALPKLDDNFTISTTALLVFRTMGK